MLERLARLLTLRPVGVMAALLTVTGIAAAFALRTEFEFAPQALFAGNHQLVDDLERFKETFAFEDSVLMVVVEAFGEEDFLDRRLLDWQADFVRRSKEVAGIDAAASIATLDVPRRTFGLVPTVVPRPLLSQFPVDEFDQQRVREFVDESPLLVGTMVSHDRRTGAILLFIDPRLQSIPDLSRVIDDVRQEISAAPLPDGYRASITGLPFLRVDTVANLQQDQQRLLPMAALIYLVTLTLVFRRLSGALLPLLSVGMGLAWTIGLAASLGATFNLVTNILPVLLLVVGVSNCVHVLDEYSEQVDTHGGDRLKAAQGTVRHMGRSCFLTLFTSAVGFASLLTARSHLLQQFAWQASLGMACMYIAIIATCGALLRFFRPLRRGDEGAPLGRAVASMGHAINRHPRLVMAGSIALFLGSLWIGRNVPVNSYMIETYEAKHPSLLTLRLVEEKLSGLLPIEVHLQAADPQRLTQPDVIRKIADFELKALLHPEVLFARSYVDILEAIANGTPGDDDDDLPLSDEELQLELQRGLFVVKRVGETVGYPQFMSPDGTEGRVLIKVRDVGTKVLQSVILSLEADLQAAFPQGSGVQVHLTGDAYVNTVAMNGIIRDMYYSLLTASLTIFITIAILFRSPRIGLIAAIPNLTPLAITLGYIGLMGYDMNVGNVIVFTISLGIACDDSIHFLYRFREELHHSGDMQTAIDRTFAGTGRAIVLSSTLLVSGLSVLLFSNFVPTRRFAELTSITMAASLIGILWLLPACISLFWKRPHPPV